MMLSFSVRQEQLIHLNWSELILIGMVDNLEVLASEMGSQFGRLSSTYLGPSFGCPIQIGTSVGCCGG